MKRFRVRLARLLLRVAGVLKSRANRLAPGVAANFTVDEVVVDGSLKIVVKNTGGTSTAPFQAVVYGDRFGA